MLLHKHKAFGSVWQHLQQLTNLIDFIFNFHKNQLWFFPLYGCSSKQKDNNTNFKLSTPENNEKAVKAILITQNIYI